jgi:hypothetical protein
MLDQGTVVEGYRIEELLGRGGMGTVFRARHVDSGRVVALKLIADRLDGAGDARFRGEGRAQAALDHPNVVTVYDAGDSPHGLYLAMRLVEGPSLAELIRSRTLGARQALALLAQVAAALDAAHAAGYVHRDVKPHNVLVADDHAYLADFGLTRPGEMAALTAPGALVGTVAYLAPEVVRGGEATAAADRYAFAAMAFECLTGSVVFPRSSDASILFAHANDPPPRIGARRPELGNALDDIFEHALAKQPRERPRSAVGLVADIDAALEREGLVDLPAPLPTGAGALEATTDSALALPPAPASTRRRLAWALVGAMVGAVAVGAAWLLAGDEEEAPAASLRADRPGLVYVGSPLDGPAPRTLDCRLRAPTGTSPACTIAQRALPGATVVIPENGAIRHWSVRGARGDVTLAVLRPRDGGAFQITLSATETAGSADVQNFTTDLTVERGDLVALRVAPGSAVGVRHSPQAKAERWLPPVPGLGRPADASSGDELLLRVGLAVGEEQRRPEQVTGAAAERLPAGKVRAERTIRQNGRPLVLRLIESGGGFSIDQLVGGRRVARVPVADMRPGASVVLFDAAAWGEAVGGVDMNFVNAESARVMQYVYDVQDGRFGRVR